VRNEPPGDESEAILNELLVLRCRRGDPDAWRELVRLWEKRLLYYIRRLLNDERDAWDALQQTWLDAFRNLKMLRNPGRCGLGFIRSPTAEPSAFVANVDRTCLLARRRKTTRQSIKLPIPHPPTSNRSSNVPSKFTGRWDNSPCLTVK